MVLDYYNLNEQPFGVTPDPRFLYMGPTHREALASLAYGIHSGRGFMALIASPGMGKTSILRHLLQQLSSSARISFLCQTLCRPEDISRGVLRDLGLDADVADVVRMEEHLNNVLLSEARSGRKVIVVIDEAQNLDAAALEHVRLLSNFETTTDKLMQIVLAGQPQLWEKLASPHLLQLRQRISIVARLQQFSPEECGLYIAHRLRTAGYDFATPLFSPEAQALIAKCSDGIPRNINNICFNALSLGCVLKQRTIQRDVIREVVADFDLNAESVHRTYIASATSGFMAWVAKRAITAHAPSFSRQTVIAFCAFLILAFGLIVSVRGGKPDLHPSRSTSLVSAEAPAAVPSTVAVLQPTVEPAADTPARLATRSAAKAEGTIATTSAPPPRQPRNREQPRVGNPTELWAQVRKQNSDAAVELARMYLEGTNVAQNCQQAQVLLLAASRKGNSRANELLTEFGNQCH